MVNLPGQSKEPCSRQLLLKWNLRAKNIKKTMLKIIVGTVPVMLAITTWQAWSLLIVLDNQTAYSISSDQFLLCCPLPFLNMTENLEWHWKQDMNKEWYNYHNNISCKDCLSQVGDTMIVVTLPAAAELQCSVLWCLARIDQQRLVLGPQSPAEPCTAGDGTDCWTWT